MRTKKPRRARRGGSVIYPALANYHLRLLPGTALTHPVYYCFVYGETYAEQDRCEKCAQGKCVRKLIVCCQHADTKILHDQAFELN